MVVPKVMAAKKRAAETVENVRIVPARKEGREKGEHEE